MNALTLLILFVFGLFCATSQAQINPIDALKLFECYEKAGIDIEQTTSKKYFDEHRIEIVNCWVDIPSLRPVIAGMQILNHIRDDNGQIQLCGFNITSSDSTDDEQEDEPELSPKFKVKTPDFCDLVFNDVLPELCELQDECPQQDLEMAFAFYYTAQQVLQGQQEPFKCKTEEENELLGNIINPDVYTTVFDFNKPILTKEMPCDGNKIAQKPGFQIASLIKKAALNSRTFRL